MAFLDFFVFGSLEYWDIEILGAHSFAKGLHPNSVETMYGAAIVSVICSNFNFGISKFWKFWNFGIFVFGTLEYRDFGYAH